MLIWWKKYKENSMNYFNMVCDGCGREVQGYNIVNGMKFCANGRIIQRTICLCNKEKKKKIKSRYG